MSYKNKPIVWSIAGSDCSGLAGQVADIRAIEALGAHPCMVTTAVTAQNSEKVIALNPLSAEQLQAQFDALKDDLPADAIKVGLLPTEDSIAVLINYLQQYSQYEQGFVVIDPVMFSDSGKQLMDGKSQTAFKSLYPLIDLLSPSISELELLTESTIKSHEDIEKATKQLLSYGIKSVLVKGGHSERAPCSDYFVSEKDSFWLHSEPSKNENTLETGCVLAASIAAAVALKHSIKDSIVIGKMQINQAIENGYSVGVNNNKGPLKPLAWPKQEKYMPKLTDKFANKEFEFPSMGKNKIGLYPVVNNAQSIEKLLAAGISCIQLRVKSLTTELVEKEIIEAVEISEKYKSRLFINEHWELAIKHGAYGVHLEQDKIKMQDIEAIEKAGLHLGIYTAGYYDVARAHAIQPSYLAFGPMFHKSGNGQGVEKLNYWIETMSSYPWIAIGGINTERVKEVAQTEVWGIAVSSTIIRAEELDLVVNRMIKVIDV